jgi:rubredoxin-NAD+ reductase
MITSGFDVEAVEPMTTVLGSLLPVEASAAVQRRLEHAGVRYHFNTVVERVDSAGDGIVATLANGDEVAADLVLSAIGVRPDLDLAKRAGLETNRGILTNRSLQTSAPNVYALGDCAEVDGHLLYYIAPLNAAAKVLARVLCGQTAEVNYGVMPVLVKTTLCPVVVSPPGIEAVGEWQIEGADDNIIARYISPEGEQLGFALTGEETQQKTALGAKNRPLMM